MKVLYRQTLKDFIGPFILAVVVMAGILLMDKIFLLIDLLVKKGIGFWVVAELMFYSLPFVMSFSIPIGILIASVMVFGRITHDNELIAIRSSGINPLSLFKPFLPVIVLITLFMVYFNGFILPEASHRARNLITDIAQKKPSVRIYEGVFIEDFPGYIIYLGSIDDRTGKVNDITIWEQKSRGEPPILIKAESGQISTSADECYFIIELDEGEISELVSPDKYRHLSFERHQINLEIDLDFIRRERKFRSNREMILTELYKRVGTLNTERQSIRQEIDKLKQSPVNEVTGFHLEDAQNKLRHKTNEYKKFLTELNKRYALAFSGIVFLFFGAALGMLLKRSGLGTGFVVGLLFFAVYYIIFIAGEEFAQSGRAPVFVSVWFANLILILVTLELLSYVTIERWYIGQVIRRLRKRR
ncbi:MAG: LptF/LptG family permease [Candidatus Latescibacteria bacterium]|nr:LptF/LptG family permease [Candidatus Latescibacterota bacterium]